MKKIILYTISLLFLASVVAQPKSITVIEADSAAKCWIKTYFPHYDPSFSSVVSYEDSLGTPILYEVSTDSIDVLMSGFNECRPVLGVYEHTDRSLIKDYINGELPCTISSFIDEYVQQIKYVYYNRKKDPYYEKMWSGLILYGEADFTDGVSEVGPLIQTQWGQSWSNDWIDRNAYNYYCPADSGCEHCVGGCVALAMSQVMNYWKAPLIQYDNHVQFDWCNMPSELWVDSADYIVQRNAVAHLIRECGIRVNMSYGCSGSGAVTSNIATALRHYGYSDSVQYVSGGNVDSLWGNRLRHQIDLGLPVVYRGTAQGSSGGHAFICDGYNSIGQFHFNWGWQGRGNGFFYLDAMTPLSYDFSYHHSAIINIFPNYWGSQCDLSIALDDFYLNFYSYQWSVNTPPPHHVTPQTAAVMISASNVQDSTFRTIPSGDTAVYRAHREIILQDGFEAEWGSDFTAEIVPCPACEDTTIGPIHPILDSLFPLTQTGGDSIDVVGDATYSHMADLGISRAEVFPNPTTGELTVVTDGMAEAIVVYNAAGQPVGGWDILSQGETWLTLDFPPSLPQGTYIVVLRTKTGTSAARVVRQ